MLKKIKLSNNSYDFWKKMCLHVLPALGALYATLATIWDLPYGVEISGSILAINTFIGGILGISTENYYEDIEVLEEENEKR